MRVIYVLITVFLVLCVFFTRWYLCDIRGLCDFPADEVAVVKTVAIVEILLMLLVAFLIGFGIAWMVRENTLRYIRQYVGIVLKERAGLNQQLQMLERENQTTRKYLAEAQHGVAEQQKLKQLAETASIESRVKLSTLQEELQNGQRRYENLKQESDTVRQTVLKLNDELAAERMKKEVRISSTSQSVTKVVETRDPSRSRFTPSTWQTRDDLTLISGIGPAIQRKLNELGIYSFRQVSELTPELIDKVSRSIKFFPDRIGRDNWIGQAAAFMKRKHS